MAGIQTKASNPPSQFLSGRTPGAIGNAAANDKVIWGEGGGKGGTVVCGGERGKRILSIGCSTCMYRIYLLYKENCEKN